MAGPSVCVYCRKQSSNSRWQPFCTERCQLADLGRWLQGDYRVPGTPVEPAEDGLDADDNGGDDPS
ncbi:MAG: DNA gyrase inhibitor YacG [Vicinamibacterales bacterium]